MRYDAGDNFTAKNVSSEKYSRGRRGAPAKGIGRVTGARVRIPLSPFRNFNYKCVKKYLTEDGGCDIIYKLIAVSQETRQKEMKKSC